jgi:ABC-2 type transport system permease protein
MDKILLIIKREYLSRVRKKSFLLLTIVGPILFALLMLAPSLMMLLPQSEKAIVVLDQPNLMDRHKGSDELQFQYANPSTYSVEDLKQMLRDNEDLYAALYIPSGESWDPDYISSNVVFFARGDISMQVESYVRDYLQKQITDEKLKVLGVDPSVIAGAKTSVKLRTIDISKTVETETHAGPKMIVGMVSGFILYFFIFIYGSMVMRSVIEEKTNRIVEVIISSVRPFQLLLGKILGVAMVGLTQFGIWVVLTMLLVFGVSFLLLPSLMDPEVIASTGGMVEDNGMAAALLSGLDFAAMINIPLVVGCFVFYFLFGYILYGALLAAVGSAVDSETDAQQFVLPVSIPLILSIIVLMRVINDPDSSLVVIMSYIPFTSPVLMMARLPFGVAPWELLLSMFLLLLTTVFFVWISGKIYRTGILMYGKKPTFKELFKWLFYQE